MASAWQGLGAEVRLLTQADGLLPRMEAFTRKLVGNVLAEGWVDVHIGSPQYLSAIADFTLRHDGRAFVR
jgi:pyruvate/2-oxoglutarate dehydrogenase complex dihydrolipoamide dehydrogenase (E3) component